MVDNITVSENIDENIVSSSSVENIYLPSGKALSPVEAYSITASEKSKFVVLLGAAGSGKTAICTSIYNHFLEGKFEDKYYFAGSKTLATFEECAYLTRPVSGRNLPAHDRTKKGTQSILHIRINEPLKNSHMNCLIADFSGEDYQNVICDIDYAKDEFQILRSAALLMVVIDGEKMCKASTRMSEIQQSISLLRTFLDANIISNDVPVIIVVSKFDLVQKAEITNWDNLIMDKFCDQLPLLQKNFTVKEVAPLSEHTDLIKVGYGIKTLFDEMLKLKIKISTNINMLNTESQFEIWGKKASLDDN